MKKIFRNPWFIGVGVILIATFIIHIITIDTEKKPDSPTAQTIANSSGATQIGEGISQTMTNSPGGTQTIGPTTIIKNPPPKVAFLNSSSSDNGIRSEFSVSNFNNGDLRFLACGQSFLGLKTRIITGYGPVSDTEDNINKCYSSELSGATATNGYFLVDLISNRKNIPISVGFNATSSVVIFYEQGNESMIVIPPQWQ